MEFPQNGYAANVDFDVETGDVGESSHGHDLNGLQRQEDDIENVEVAVSGQPVSTNHHPVQVREF